MAAGAQLSACSCGEDDLWQWKISSKLGKERQRCTVGVRRAVSKISETADLFPYSAISVVSNGPKHRKPVTAQDASNLEVDELLRQLTKTTPAATFLLSIHKKLGPQFAHALQNTNKNVASSEKILNLSMVILKVRLRIWCKLHASTEPPCLCSGGGVMGILSWQTLGHLIPIVVSFQDTAQWTLTLLSRHSKLNWIQL